MKPPLVLICDHRGEGSDLRANALAAAGFEARVSSQLQQSLERIAGESPAVVVVDPLAGTAGAEIVAVDRARSGAGRGGILILLDATGGGSLPGIAHFPRHGPWDIARRDAPDEELVLRVRKLQRSVEDVRETERLRYLATHDDRTELLRPQVFQDQLRAHFSAAQRHQLHLALLLIDLDDFGRINKQHNHTIGDAVIARVGDAIREALRTEDVAGRLGGDEFGVLLPYTRKVDAARVVQRLLDEIKRASGEIPGARGPIEISASIGFETFDGRDLASVEELRLNAEEALRSAKQRGGNRGVYYRQLSDSAGAV
jgi:diguanylate cyclase (GGDEF)-like protein